MTMELPVFPVFPKQMLPDVLALPILMSPINCDPAMSKSVVVSKELDRIPFDAVICLANAHGPFNAMSDPSPPMVIEFIEPSPVPMLISPVLRPVPIFKSPDVCCAPISTVPFEL